MPKKIETLLKTKINPKITTDVLVFILIMFVSFIIASLLPISGGSSNAKLPTNGNTNTTPPPPPPPPPPDNCPHPSPSGTRGYCVWKDNTNTHYKGYSGGEMTSGECKGKLQAPSDCNGNGSIDDWWIAFCPGVTGPSVDSFGEDHCNGPMRLTGQTVDINPNIEAQATRSAFLAMSNQLNDGDKATPDRSGLTYKYYHYAIDFGIQCSAGSAENATPVLSDDRREDEMFSPDNKPILRFYSGVGEVKGIEELLLKFSKMFNKSVHFDTTTYQCHSDFPAPTKVFSTFREEDSDSFHGYGKAIDLGYAVAPYGQGESVSAEPTTNCSTNTQKILDAVKANNEGFDIIRECNKQEKNTCGDGKDSQLIHIDLGTPPPNKNRSGNPPEGSDYCLWEGCDFTNCKQ